MVKRNLLLSSLKSIVGKRTKVKILKAGFPRDGMISHDLQLNNQYKIL